MQLQDGKRALFRKYRKSNASVSRYRLIGLRNATPGPAKSSFDCLEDQLQRLVEWHGRLRQLGREPHQPPTVL
jgi:hypothetical protein